MSKQKKNTALLLLSIIIIIIKKKLKQKTKHKRWANRKWYVRPINQNRQQQGEYNNLFKELKEFEDKRMFFEYSRMSAPQLEKLLRLVELHLVKKSKRALIPEERLIIALRYLVTGNSISSIAFSFRVGQSTVRNIIKEVCVVIFNTLSPLYLKAPTEEDWKSIVDGYWNTWQMPNCFGAVDGKHIKLKCPPNSGSCYYNYKKYFSIVLMAICDHLYKFKLVDVGAYGGNSDGGIFDASVIGKNLKNGQLNLPKDNAKLPGSDISIPGYFIGDAAFALTTRIMKPYGGTKLTNAQKIFNYRHSRARRTIESSFGILASRWQIFLKTICMLPETVDKITFAAVCLHNFLMYEEQKDGTKEYSQEIDGDVLVICSS